jgi:hypothetical protein
MHILTHFVKLVTIKVVFTHGFLKVNIPFTSSIGGTRADERRSVHHRGLFTPPLELPSPLLNTARFFSSPGL